MTPFKKIPATAAKRAGGEAQLKKLLPQAKSAKALKSVSDDRYLSMMSLRVSRPGSSTAWLRVSGRRSKKSSPDSIPNGCGR